MMNIFNAFKRKGIFSLLMVSLLIVVFSCDKEEDGNSPVNQEGGEIYQYQLVEINYPNELPPESEFEATLGEVPVTVNKTNEHTLKFVVPTNMPLGYAELIIPELSNTTVKYTVLAPQLAQTADETMENFMASGSSFFSTPNPANSQFETAKGNFELFQEYFEQHATTEEKRQIALFYQVNKPMIDDLMVFNPDNLSSRFTAEDILIITKFTTAVAISVGGAFSVLYTPEISLKILGAAISGLAACRAIDYHDQLAARSIKVVLFDLGGLVGQSSRGIQNGVVVLQSDIAENINFQIGSRPLQQSDADSDNASLASFFSSQSTYNENIVKLNNVIASVNTFTPSFLQFSTFDLASLVTNPQTVNQQVTPEMMQDISFSINHPNLQLINATVSDQGQLNLKVKIVGEPASTPITSTLNYTYSDEISSFSGSFPLRISAESVCGDVIDIDGNVYESVTIGTQCWMKSNLNVSRYRNGDVIPQVTSQEAWAELTTGAWCYYENNTANGTVYGKLYNWYAVTDPRGLAPEGYHVPSDAEWTIIVDFLGGETVAGGKMKSQSGWITGWGTGDNGTNSSGFNSKPAGRRFSGGAFDYHGTSYWSTTDYVNVQWNVEGAYNREIPSSGLTIVKFGNVKSEGYSIRCLKD